ncbi:nucleotidyltransferase family protein [Thioalkalivibrio sp. AKL8]|uniref:nucleotidyltransferase family protein n=1 Tax=Thioalkalivibrio sp. AKL8 TaxID=1158156 RepID=UPI000367BE54|nr:nucleotidyltransferase domain-containing protein [Thioalkalivibrio sp. AKL8]
MASTLHASTGNTAEALPPRERVNHLAHAAAELVREEFGQDAKVFWFGSWPRGTARWNSDIDLAVLPAKEVSISDWGRLRGHIEDLRTLYTFDLVDMTEVSDELRKEIESEGIPL